jgi:uncharacterized protein (DUF1330 family)
VPAVGAYVIIDLDIYDIETYLEYQHALQPLLDAAGARYLARGGAMRVYEGDYQPRRLVVLAFPSLEAVDTFYTGDAYRSLEAQRNACCSACIVGVKGL